MPTSSPAEVHVEGEENFVLRPGGHLRALVERGEEDSVHVRGRLAARLGLQCGRCLEPFELPVDQELDLFYLPHRPDAAADGEEEEDDVGLSDHDMVVAFYRGGELDLGQMVREQFFLAVPMKHLCREDCAGLCPTCGINRNQAKLRVRARGDRSPAGPVEEAPGQGRLVISAAY